MNETWRPILGFPGYEVSSLGRVRSWKPQGFQKRLLSTPRLLSIRNNRLGYPIVSLRSSRKCSLVTVHRLVLLAFWGPCPEGCVGTHLDGTRTNNRPENLAWRTQAENMGDKRKHGTTQEGERNGFAKLTDDKVREIHALWGLITIAGLAKRYGVGKSAIVSVQQGRRWGHVYRP